MILASREVILGISAGISAYKSADLLRRLQELNFDVTVIPTQSSLNFVGSATWEALSGHPVQTNLWNNVYDVPHIKLAKMASLIIIAPTTADLLAKIANGLADDLLTNVVLAANAPLILVPAMHPEMWANAATQENVAKLRSRGALVIEPDEGRMTGLDYGVGRYPTVEKIVSQVTKYLEISLPLAGVKVLITAGGTREAIDPVRYIGNRSSGKQGFAIAKAALAQGAEVTLVAANVNLPTPIGAIRIDVESALELHREVIKHFNVTNLLFMSAAVADVRPDKSSDQKIRKSNLQAINLRANIDILADVSESKKKQIIVAFAAETSGDMLEEAKRKLVTKKADLLYLNDVTDGAVFGSEQTSGWILDSSGQSDAFDLSNKDTLAFELLKRAMDKLG
ncbi:MAG: bifunctional phosphopantothenoylcysteine decarboxylase/phosphopantothenate--cysteine ligase CoaBC [Actinobacteria bacterium]|nr:bifunctional phosphopantothenoylcysteine decarboxylase/phosphopantothenate--cysteine ligase CoaBC [Actinomycetota bacterium]